MRSSGRTRPIGMCIGPCPRAVSHSNSKVLRSSIERLKSGCSHSSRSESPRVRDDTLPLLAQPIDTESDLLARSKTCASLRAAPETQHRLGHEFVARAQNRARELRVVWWSGGAVRFHA